jgi:hypothetical protein
MRAKQRRSILLLAVVAGAASVAADSIWNAGGRGASGAAQTTGAAPTATPSAMIVDDFEDAGRWTAHPADGVELRIGSDTGSEGSALRLDFHFTTGSGYAVVRRDLALELPENYAFSFRIRGDAPANHLEFKLVDSTGTNVWWSVRRDTEFPADWETITIKKRHISFAWGPQGGGEIQHVAAIELAITAGRGGTGTVWIDELELQERPPPDATPPDPIARASTARHKQGAQHVLDGDPASFWSCAADDSAAWILLDFGQLREYGGLVLDWHAERQATDYDVEASDDGTTWRTLRTVRGSNGGRDYIYIPESESRYLRVQILQSANGKDVALTEASVQPLEWSATREAFFQAVARDAPRGCYPRGMLEEQSYWTVVGVDGDSREALLGEDGAVETGRGRFSIEPFLLIEGRLITWDDARAAQELDDGSLPIPSVAWDVGELRLNVTAFAIGRPDSSSVVVRYRVANRGEASRHLTLFLVARPFQVNPLTQTLNQPGGTAPIGQIALVDRSLEVNGERAVVCLTQHARFGAATFDAGDVVADHLRHGQIPSYARAHDPFDAASGALAFPLDLPASSEREVDLLVQLHPDSPVPQLANDAAARRWVERELSRCRSDWRQRLGRVRIELPDAAAPVVATLRSQLAYILVNRAGPAIQPGPRSYARSWIRDGALTSSALLRLHHTEPVRAFLEWYAPNQYASGKIPCVVDARGPDPVPEHDSHGEFIFLVAEYYRYTGDRALAEKLWPRVRNAATYMDSLRAQRRTPEFRTPDKRMFFGLLPPSISHEGYSAKPMHSYWDNFFALRGFADAAYIARSLGYAKEAEHLQRVHDEFAQELGASIEVAMLHHGIDYVPGCADLGDFDPTSTTIALSPVGAESVMPPEATLRTFERYYDFFRERRDGAAWDAYTPYEIRNVGAFVRLGWRRRAHELLDYFLAHQRPSGWRQWPEVVWRDARMPRFLGDLPHTWVGSDYVRSLLDLFAYERESDAALVVAAGVHEAWLEPPGLEVRNLQTRFGPLSYAMRRDGDAIEIRIEAGIRMPPGGVVILPPLDEPIREVSVDGVPETPLSDTQVEVRKLPTTLRVRP